ncbi:MAG TPA: hypothetical protein VGL81_11730 [Polyangiaceae bacterium]
MMTRPVLVAAMVSLLAAAACAKDVVLPDLGTEPVCGNDLLETGEACDVSSPGCVDCQVAPGWTCPNDVCTQTCGDGVVGTGATCADPHRDTDCDLTGYWAVSETDYTCDDIFHQPQTSSDWRLYHLVQTGNDFQVDEALDCGVHVTGSATVDYTPPSLSAVMYLNAMDGTGSHPARTGTSQATAGGCAVTLDRWYDIRGALETYLPADFSTMPALTSLPALPSVSDPVDGDDSLAAVAGTTDPDGDGFAGLGFQITGIVTGVRDSAQRDWKQYATTGTPVPAAALTFDVPGAFDLQENILHVSQCGTGCGLLATGAAASTAAGKVTFSFIGKTLGSSRVAAIVAGVPRQNVTADLATCANVRQAIPHDASAPSNACPQSSP